MLIEVIYRFSKKESREINKLEDEKKMFSIERFSKSEGKYWLIVRLKAIKYKENFFLLFIFLFLTSSFSIFIISRRSCFHKFFIIFIAIFIFWVLRKIIYIRANYCIGGLSSTKLCYQVYSLLITILPYDYLSGFFLQLLYLLDHLMITH